MVLAVFGDSDKDGAPIVQSLFDNQLPLHQFFIIDNLGVSDDLVKLRHPGGGNKVITVWDASKLDFAPIILSEWRQLDNQRFFIHDVGDNLFRLIAKHSGRVLEVFGASFLPGAPIVQSGSFFHGDDNQLWRIERIEQG